MLNIIVLEYKVKLHKRMVKARATSMIVVQP